MTRDSTNWLVPAGAITAALVAGLFSFLNLVLSKEQKLSELRQAWIDGLREDLCSYFAALTAIQYIDEVFRHEQGEKLDFVALSEAVREPHRDVVLSSNRILLRLSPNDRSPSHKKLIEELNASKRHFNESRFSDAIRCIPAIRENGQLVLKSEWKRVKRGEPTFRLGKARHDFRPRIGAVTGNRLYF
ncbi:MAG TPA: hypothetical protein VGW57_05780 [Chthoniobacterales bacterium]|nr:hypothetical protein [Chthoniobacterales bacterium]